MVCVRACVTLVSLRQELRQGLRNPGTRESCGRASLRHDLRNPGLSPVGLSYLCSVDVPCCAVGLRLFCLGVRFVAACAGMLAWVVSRGVLFGSTYGVPCLVYSRPVCSRGLVLLCARGCAPCGLSLAYPRSLCFGGKGPWCVPCLGC